MQDASILEDDEGGSCGWWTLKPKFLQKFRTPKWALFWLCWAGALQGKLTTHLHKLWSNPAESGMCSINSVLGANKISCLWHHTLSLKAEHWRKAPIAKLAVCFLQVYDGCACIYFLSGTHTARCGSNWLCGICLQTHVTEKRITDFLLGPILKMTHM